MKIIQKYAMAVVSSNLRDDEHNHQTEVLAAVALSGSLGSDLFRAKYSLQPGSYVTLLEAWKDVVKAKSISRQWPSEVSANKVARLSLDHWICDVCPLCVGRGHLPYVSHLGEVTEKVLADDPCPACNGTAKKPIDVKPHMVVKYVTDMVEALDAMTIHAGGEAMRKLSSEMDLP